MLSEINNSGNDRLRSCLLLVVSIVAVISLLWLQNAVAVDGNYSSPYASQWDNRSVGLTIPNETLLGILLVTLNLFLASFYFLRYKLRQRRKAA